VLQPGLGDASVRVSRVCPPLRHHCVGPGGIEIALHGIDPITQSVGPHVFLGERPLSLGACHHQRGV
jgi:hypothetical protein